MTWIFVTKTLKYKEAKQKQKRKKKKKKKAYRACRWEFGAVLKWVLETFNLKWVYVY